MYPVPLFNEQAPILLAFVGLVLFFLGRSRHGQPSVAISGSLTGTPVEHDYRQPVLAGAVKTDFQYMLMDRLTLHSQVKCAIEYSLQVNTVVGVVVVQNSHLTDAIKRKEVDTAIGALDRIREIVAMPHFLHVTNTEIVIFLPRLKFRATLEELAKKLQQCLTGYGTLEQGGAPCLTGTAMYPIDGYGSEELLASAKSRVTAQKETIHIRKVGNFLHFELSASRKTLLNMAVSRAHARVMAG